MTKGFEIKIIKPVAVDERGTTFEWKLNNGHQISIYSRKKGSKLGGHFHKGGDPSKNPERFYLMVGKIKIIFIEQDGKRIEKILEANSSLLIRPNVKHWMIPLTDVTYIEYRITHFDPDNPDTYPCVEKVVA